MVTAVVVAFLVASCASQDEKPPALPLATKTHGTGGGPVVLGEGDSIKLYFAGSPEYNSVQKIRTDGKISLPLIGEVQAAGKTLPRLQSELTSSFKPLLQNSEVVVSLEASGKPVIISGGVSGPGKFVYDRPTTLLEAIMGAGGFTDFAKRKEVRLIRLVKGQYRTEVYDMSKAFSGGATPVVYVQGGDVIYIPVSNW